MKRIQPTGPHLSQARAAPASRLILKTLSLLISALALVGAAAVSAADPLPSWNDSAPKKAIIAFVERVTKEGSPDFVPVPERIAVFDNDGTLWAEQPRYFQFQFALDRVKALAPQHPEWTKKQPFKKLFPHPKKNTESVRRVARFLGSPSQKL